MTLWDNGVASWLDLGAQFYLNESHVKSSANRAAASLAQLKELNPYVTVELLESEEITDQARGCAFFAITFKISRILTEDIELKDSTDSKLQIESLCSIRILSILETITETSFFRKLRIA